MLMMSMIGDLDGDGRSEAAFGFVGTAFILVTRFGRLLPSASPTPSMSPSIMAPSATPSPTPIPFQIAPEVVAASYVIDYCDTVVSIDAGGTIAPSEIVNGEGLRFEFTAGMVDGSFTDVTVEFRTALA